MGKVWPSIAGCGLPMRDVSLVILDIFRSLWFCSQTCDLAWDFPWKKDEKIFSMPLGFWVEFTALWGVTGAFCLWKSALNFCHLLDFFGLVSESWAGLPGLLVLWPFIFSKELPRMSIRISPVWLLSGGPVKISPAWLGWEALAVWVMTLASRPDSEPGSGTRPQHLSASSIACCRLLPRRLEEKIVCRGYDDCVATYYALS